MPSTLGTPATTIMLQGFSNHFTHVEFEAVAPVFKGQPVKLDTAGKVTPYIAGDDPSMLIGISHADAAAAELVTVATRGLGVVNAQANAAMFGGLAKVHSYYATNSRVLYIQGTDTTDFNGWALDAAAAQYDNIRVLIKM
tara:strand:+ start:1576 stop:1995 length:420 start_codon:yes stop_codon:yes gene_type:complete